MRETPLEATGMYAHNIEYPASKEKVLEIVARNGAPADMIELLRAAPYERFTQVSEIHSALWLQTSGNPFRGDVTASSPWTQRGSKSA